MAVWSIKQLSALPRLRLDAEYYRPEYLAKQKQLSDCETVSVGEIAFVTDGIHASPDVVEEGGITYLSANCVKDNHFYLADALQISKKQDSQNKRTRLQTSDVLLTTVGTIGNAAVVTEDILPANIDRHVGLIRLSKDSGFDPYYVSTFLNSEFGRFQTIREATGNVQLNLFIEKIKELRIPKVPYARNIAKMTRQACLQMSEGEKFHKNAESVLMTELGLADVDLPNDLFFVSPHSETQSAHRFDAEYFEPRYYAIEKAISTSGFPVLKLGEIIEPIRNGFDYRTFVNQGTSYIRVGDIQDGRINIIDAEKVSIAASDITKNIHLIPGDILLTRKGSFGNSAVVQPGQEDSIISSEIMLLRLKDKRILPEYLSAFLNSPLGFLQIERRVHGVAFFSISQSELASVSVVLAPQSLQKKVAEGLAQAQKAWDESFFLLEDGKRRVTECILTASR